MNGRLSRRAGATIFPGACAQHEIATAGLGALRTSEAARISIDVEVKLIQAGSNLHVSRISLPLGQMYRSFSSTHVKSEHEKVPSVVSPLPILGRLLRGCSKPQTSEMGSWKASMAV